MAAARATKFEVDEVDQRPGEIKQRLAGADPFAFLMHLLDIELCAARRRL